MVVELAVGDVTGDRGAVGAIEREAGVAGDTEEFVVVGGAVGCHVSGGDGRAEGDGIVVKEVWLAEKAFTGFGGIQTVGVFSDDTASVGKVVAFGEVAEHAGAGGAAVKTAGAAGTCGEAQEQEEDWLLHY